MLVAFAGCDGVGKTTIMHAVQSKLIEKGYSVKALKPLAQGTEFSDNIRAIRCGYEENAHTLNNKIRVLIAYETLRISKIISAELENFDFILLDRWTLCQIVYAIVWQNEEPLADHILQLCIKPDITILIDGDEDMVNRHIDMRSEREDIEDRAALRRILRTYRKFAANDNSIKMVVNEAGLIEKTIENVLEYLGVSEN